MKNKDLVINEWYKGIAESPHLGFGDMKNMDITTRPGVIQPNFSTTKQSSTTVTDAIKWFAVNPDDSDIFALGDDGKVYTSTNGGGSWSLISGNTTTSADGDGLAVWKDYLFVARNTNLDVYGPLSGSASWTNGWQTLTSTGLGSTTAFHPMLVGQDDILYIGNASNLASVAENTGQNFAPGTSATYTFSSSALDLPEGYKIKCLEELGTNLMIGTWQGSNIFDLNIADIFPWDRSSSSFGLPIRLNTNGVNAMINKDNLLYIFAGIRGEIYISNGTSTRLLRKLPLDITALEGGTFMNYYPGAVMSHNDRVYFATSAGTGGHTADAFGVWSISPNGSLAYENQISTGTTDFVNGSKIGALLKVNAGTYLIGWEDNSVFGIDQTESSNRYTSYASYIQSPLYRVGVPLAPTQFQQIDILFDKALASGDGIKIKYRKNLSDSFTTLGTYDFASYGAVDNINVDFTSDSFVNLQFQIELTNNARLREIRVK